MILTILLGYIPIVVAMVGGSLYFIDYITSTIRLISSRRRIRKKVKEFYNNLKGIKDNGN